MIRPSPFVEVQNGAGQPFVTTELGVDVTPGAVVTIRPLPPASGIATWSLEVLGSDERAPNPRLTVDAARKVATLIGPPPGSALILASVVNGGKSAAGNDDARLGTTFGLYTRTPAGYRVGALNETTEGNAFFGWLDTFNALLRGGAAFPQLVVDAASPNLALGDGVCITGTGTITKATPAALALAGTVLGLALSAGTAGERITVLDNGVVDPFTSSLGPGAAGPVRLDPQTARPARTLAFGADDAPLGFANAEGYLTLVRGVVVGRVPDGAAGGDLGGAFPNPTVEKLRGAALPPAGALTPGHVLLAKDPSTLAFAPLDLSVTTGIVAASRLPLDVAGGVPSLDAQARLVPARLPLNVSGGVPSLDALARLPPARLPRRRDDPSTVALRWKLDEAAAPFAASGTLGGGAATLAATGVVSPNVRSVFRRGVRFFSSQYAYLSGGATQKVTGSALTESLWVTVPTPSAASNAYFFAGRAYRASATWTNPFVTWSLSALSDGTLRGQITTGTPGAGASVDLTSDFRIPPLTPVFLALTYNGSNFALFANGFQVATRSATGALDYNDAATPLGAYFVGSPPVPAATSGAFPLGAIVEDLVVENAAIAEDVLRLRYLRAFGLFEEAA